LTSRRDSGVFLTDFASELSKLLMENYFSLDMKEEGFVVVARIEFYCRA
jgi:hypothetical protein